VNWKVWITIGLILFWLGATAYATGRLAAARLETTGTPPSQENTDHEQHGADDFRATERAACVAPACSQAPDGRSSAVAQGKTYTVEVDNFAFRPVTITANLGDTIVWLRLAGVHNIYADDGSFAFGGADGKPSGTWTSAALTLTRTGVINYYCQAHGLPGLFMAGAIVVKEGNQTSPTPTPTRRAVYLPLIRK
jgi:plastocyanin